MNRRLKRQRSGYHFDKKHIEKHLGKDSFYSSQFTKKSFFDDDYVEKMVLWAFNHMKDPQKVGETYVDIAYKGRTGKKLIIGHGPTNGHIPGKEDPYSVLRICFRYLPKESDGETELWVTTSLYPVRKADKLIGTITIK